MVLLVGVIVALGPTVGCGDEATVPPGATDAGDPTFFDLPVDTGSVDDSAAGDVGPTDRPAPLTRVERAGDHRDAFRQTLVDWGASEGDAEEALALLDDLMERSDACEAPIASLSAADESYRLDFGCLRQADLTSHPMVGIEGHPLLGESVDPARPDLHLIAVGDVASPPLLVHSADPRAALTSLSDSLGFAVRDESLEPLFADMVTAEFCDHALEVWVDGPSSSPTRITCRRGPLVAGVVPLAIHLISPDASDRLDVLVIPGSSGEASGYAGIRRTSTVERLLLEDPSAAEAHLVEALGVSRDDVESLLAPLADFADGVGACPLEPLEQSWATGTTGPILRRFFASNRPELADLCGVEVRSLDALSTASPPSQDSLVVVLAARSADGAALRWVDRESVGAPVRESLVATWLDDEADSLAASLLDGGDGDACPASTGLQSSALLALHCQPVYTGSPAIGVARRWAIHEETFPLAELILAEPTPVATLWLETGLQPAGGSDDEAKLAVAVVQPLPVDTRAVVAEGDVEVVEAVLLGWGLSALDAERIVETVGEPTDPAPAVVSGDGERVVYFNRGQPLDDPDAAFDVLHGLAADGPELELLVLPEVEDAVEWLEITQGEEHDVLRTVTRLMLDVEAPDELALAASEAIGEILFGGECGSSTLLSHADVAGHVKVSCAEVSFAVERPSLRAGRLDVSFFAEEMRGYSVGPAEGQPLFGATFLRSEAFTSATPRRSRGLLMIDVEPAAALPRTIESPIEVVDARSGLSDLDALFLDRQLSATEALAVVSSLQATLASGDCDGIDAVRVEEGDRRVVFGCLLAAAPDELDLFMATVALGAVPEFSLFAVRSPDDSGVDFEIHPSAESFRLSLFESAPASADVVDRLVDLLTQPIEAGDCAEDRVLSLDDERQAQFWCESWPTLVASERADGVIAVSTAQIVLWRVDIDGESGVVYHLAVDDSETESTVDVIVDTFLTSTL